MKFNYDFNKSKINEDKHGVTLKEAEAEAETGNYLIVWHNE
jgi:uncharacterized DUF497 family protein